MSKGNVKLKRYLKKKRISQTDLGAVMGLSRSRFARKINNYKQNGANVPEDFTFKELKIIYKVTRMKPEEFAKIFLND